MTLALLAGSAAIDAGDDAVSGSPLNLTTDQRGRPRRNGVHVDIGAFEAGAAALTVTNLNDSGPGSLRHTLADASPVEADTIVFASNLLGAINLTSGELLINKNLTINGPGANLLTVQRSTAPGTPAFRIFNIIPNSGIATISGLTIANGIASSENGGNGGGIANSATLTISNSTISGNSASSGGGIVSSRPMTIINSTISGNSATGNGFGGGIYNTDTLTITNSTISGNSASSGLGIGSGGGIHNVGGTVGITSSTISGNTAQFRGGGVGNPSGMVRSRNTIIALNTAPNAGPDVNGALTSQGFNLIGNNSGATITPLLFSDQIGVSAAQVNLGPLQNNGGATQTHALLSGSAAIDKGDSSGAAADQRGRLRTYDFASLANASGGDGSDIGAFELQLPTLTLTGPVKSGNNMVVSFSGDLGQRYRIERKDVLAPGAWTTVTDNIAGTGGVVPVTDLGAAIQPKRFYRGQVLP